MNKQDEGCQGEDPGGGAAHREGDGGQTQGHGAREWEGGVRTAAVQRTFSFSNYTAVQLLSHIALHCLPFIRLHPMV